MKAVLHLTTGQNRAPQIQIVVPITNVPLGLVTGDSFSLKWFKQANLPLSEAEVISRHWVGNDLLRIICRIDNSLAEFLSAQSTTNSSKGSGIQAFALPEKKWQ